MDGGPRAPPGAFRPDLYVVARFLEALGSEGVAHPKTRLQNEVRLNYDLFLRYLTFLERKGLVRIEPQNPGSDHVFLTPEGEEARARLARWIARWIEGSRL